MAAMSDYLENAWLNHVFRNVALASPAAVYLALYLDDPTDADTGTEVSGGSYARQAITFSAPSGGVIDNSVIITFPAATADWGLITHYGIHDALAAGNLLVHSQIATQVLVQNGDTFSVPLTQLTVTGN